MKKRLNKKTFIGSIIIIVYFLLIYFLEYILQAETIINILIIALISMVLLIIFNVIKECKKNKRINYRKIILLIIVIGVILRSIYILDTDIIERQHDVLDESGHLDYIETIYTTGKLPENNKWQFYQQPLHHLVSTVWIKINESLGLQPSNTLEGIQNLTAIYSSIIMLITYCILRELKIKNVYKMLVIMIIAVHPTFIILSGSINNDILMIMFTFLAILYLIKWNKKSNYRNTIILALITALIALTKISGTIIAVPIIYVFVNKFIKEYYRNENRRKIIGKYLLKVSVFSIIALGIGLSYSVRNNILFNQAIFHVPLPGSALYCGDKTNIERFNIFSKEILCDTYCHPLTDYNIPAYLIKSSLFGEFNLDNMTYSHIIPKLLIIINCLIIIISVINWLMIICNYEKLKKRTKVYINIFQLLYISEIIMYLTANLSMPFGCTMDFRYIVPTILTGMMFIIINMMTEKKNKLLKLKVIYTLVIIFSILSIIFEIIYMRWLTI